LICFGILAVNEGTELVDEVSQCLLLPVCDALEVMVDGLIVVVGPACFVSGQVLLQ